jgi:glycine/D-amino acid oxidase-like deaminating enzyme
VSIGPARSVDVAIIGGGIVGTSLAAELAGRGARVTLYEREALAAGASGRNSGVLQQPFDPALVGLYEETVALYRRVADEVPGAGISIPPEPAGLLLVSRRAAVVGRLAADLRAAFPTLEVEALEGPAVHELEPALAPGIAACRVGIGYPLVPSAPTFACATLAERRGATIRLGRAARPAIAGDRCDGVIVDGQREPADAVVVAAGPWTPELVDATGAWRPIRPLWGVVVETTLADPPRHVLEEAAMDEALGTAEAVEATGAPGSAGAAGAEPEAAAAAEPRPKFSLMTAAGGSVVGSTYLHDEPDPAGWQERILERAVSFVPSLLEAPIRGVRACARPLSADGRPLIGAVPGIAGLFVCAGHGPWGISTGPGSARLVADLVLDGTAAIPADLDAGRFGDPATPRPGRPPADDPSIDPLRILRE